MALPAASAEGKACPGTVSGVEIRTAPQSASSAKTRAVLVVQQHGGSSDTTLVRQQIGDWLQTALGAVSLSVVNPHDVIGTMQNVGPWGEKMPESSAVSLAGELDAALLLTASVTDVRIRHVEGTEPGEQAVLDLTLSAKAVPGGELLSSANAVARSRKEEDMAAFQRNAAELWSAVAKEAAFSAASALLDSWGKSGAPVQTSPVRAFFAANVPGANVRIDGVSRGIVGTAPLAVSIAPGLHNVEISCPGMVPFRDLVMIREGVSFVTVLAFTDEAIAAARSDATFQAYLDRARRSGLTDDLVRELVARGYAKYLEASHTKLDGMPQNLAIGGNAPDLGLAPVAPERPAAAPTTAELLQRAEELVHP